MDELIIYIKSNFNIPDFLTIEIAEKLTKREITIEQLEANHYLLIEDIPFEKIEENKKAKTQSINFRIIASIYDVARSYFNTVSDTAITKKDFQKCCQKILSLTENEMPLLSEVISKMISIGVLKSINNNIITNGFFFAVENFILQTVTIQSKKSKGLILSNKKVEEFIQKQEKSVGFPYADKQKEIIRLANKNYNIFCLNGYAGTGKTTTALSILNLFSGKYGKPNIICCAFSGVAANRIKQVTNYNSKTIHSLLEFNGTVFKRNENNKLEYSFIFVDEAGMTGSELFASLLSAIDFSKTTLLIAGDLAQLQPVSNGDVFRDLIECNHIQAITLDKVYRQKEEQVINLMAQSIRKGELFADYKNDFEDFKFIEANKEQITPTIKMEILKHKWEQENLLLSGKYSDFVSNFQIIAPIKKGEFGVNELNTVAQKLYNYKQTKQKITINKDRELLANDKVIHLKNTNINTISYKAFLSLQQNGFKDSEKVEMQSLRVFNGQIGVILKIDTQSKTNSVYVYYPNEHYIAIYSLVAVERYGLLDLAYAITVHKSQGSQYKNVLMPMVSQYASMLNTQLIYTAITRAKDNLVVVGEDVAFIKGSTNIDENKRLTIINKGGTI